METVQAGVWPQLGDTPMLELALNPSALSRGVLGLGAILGDDLTVEWARFFLLSKELRLTQGNTSDCSTQAQWHPLIKGVTQAHKAGRWEHSPQGGAV